MKSYFFLFSIAFIFFLSVFTKCNNLAIKPKKQKVIVKKEIPSMPDGNFFWFYNIKNELEKKLNLNSLEEGFDSLQIRIWFEFPNTNDLQIITIKNTSSKWSGEFYVIKNSLIESSNSKINVSRKEWIPIDGWKRLIDSIQEIEIMSVPAIENLNDYSICNDGYGVTIETSTKTKYRIFSYPCYSENKSISAIKITKFMKILNEQINIK